MLMLSETNLHVLYCVASSDSTSACSVLGVLFGARRRTRVRALCALVEPDQARPTRDFNKLQKVGKFVDYDEGLVTFYDVEARVHIYSAIGLTFSEPLYPFLCTGLRCHSSLEEAPAKVSGVSPEEGQGMAWWEPPSGSTWDMSRGSQRFHVHDRSKADADREIADGVQVFTALMRYIEKWQDDFNQTVKERLESTEKEAEDFIKRLEQEVKYLTNRSSEVKQLSHTEDHLHFLQTFRSLKNPPPIRDWTTVEVRPPSYVGTLRRSLDQLQETLNMEMKKLCDAAELKRVQQYELDVTLDPDTAPTQLILSEDGKQVHDGDIVKKLPDNPKRFTKKIYILTRQSFSSGRFYFEVQVKDKTAWRLGVARESINRKCWITVTPENGYWTLYLDNDGLVFNDNPAVRLPLRAELQKVGVFVDYDEGLVSFYDVEARVHIYSATGCTFSEPLNPFLSPGLYDYKGINSAPLIISPVNQTD
ncbi:unnamed protein product [Lota lota]